MVGWLIGVGGTPAGGRKGKERKATETSSAVGDRRCSSVFNICFAWRYGSAIRTDEPPGEGPVAGTPQINIASCFCWLLYSRAWLSDASIWSHRSHP